MITKEIQLDLTEAELKEFQETEFYSPDEWGNEYIKDISDHKDNTIRKLCSLGLLNRHFDWEKEDYSFL